MFPRKSSVGIRPAAPAAARNVRLSYTNGSANLSVGGSLVEFPTLTLHSAATVSGGRLVIPPGGNQTTRVYGNSAVDSLFRLDDLTGTYKCKYWAMNVKRHVGVTPFTASERLGQYSRQGSDATTNAPGGWVFRINYGTEPFPTGSISVAIHTDYLASPPKGDFGNGQNDPNYLDPIYTSAVISDSDWEAGVSIMMAVLNTVSPFQVLLWVNGVLEGGDAQTSAALPYYPLPGIDDNGAPANSTIAGGLVFYAQSKDNNTAVLKDAEVTPVVVGEAIDLTHLANIAAALHADPFTTSLPAA